MWLAHHFPGMSAPPHEFVDSLRRLTPEQQDALEVAGGKVVKERREERLAHTKGIMSAAAGRRLF